MIRCFVYMFILIQTTCAQVTLEYYHKCSETVQSYHLDGPYAHESLRANPCNNSSTSRCIAIEKFNPNAIAWLLTDAQHNDTGRSIPTLLVPPHSLDNITMTTLITIDEPNIYQYAFAAIFVMAIGTYILYTCITSITLKKWIAHMRGPTYGKVVRYGTFCEDTPLLSKDGCSICMEPFVNSDEILVLHNCSHVFHKECIGAWVETKQCDAKCPNCRIII